MNKKNLYLLYVSFLLCNVIVTSCNNEVDELPVLSNSKLTPLSYDSIPKARSGGAYNFSAKGGEIRTTCGVVCRIMGAHVHSTTTCQSSIRPQSNGWYSVKVEQFVYVTVAVKPNDTYISRTATISGLYGIDNIIISQEAKKMGSSDIIWGSIKDQYKIQGPQGLREDADTTCTFSLSGPFLSSDDIKVYWSVKPHWNSAGKGTVIRGQGTPSVDIFFPFDREFGCTGVVQARIEPVKKPTEGFTVEHKLVMR